MKCLLSAIILVIFAGCWQSLKYKRRGDSRPKPIRYSMCKWLFALLSYLSGKGYAYTTVIPHQKCSMIPSKKD